ncbi:hypothetical protein HDV05_006665 [Chytridiales sp. JEL 0842]|nr:hypothetical protein HDV05_006665 [Chytridiales sp. JEL 0842]
MGKDATPAKPTPKAGAAPAAEKDKAEPAVVKKTKVALEDDDDFEDFPADKGWEESTESEKLNAWEDAWEDDDEAEDFAVLLKSEMEKKTGVAPMKM